MSFNEVDTVFCDSGVKNQALLPTFQRNLQPPFAVYKCKPNKKGYPFCVSCDFLSYFMHMKLRLA